MADSAVAVTAGIGTNIDTRTEGTNGNHRAVVVLGDPATNAGVAPVDATAGLKVDLGADNDITGTVTANLSATDNAVLDTIDAVLDTIKTDSAALVVDAAASEALLTTIDGDTGAIKTATEATQTALETAGGLVVNLGANNDVTVTGTVDLGATDNAVLDTIDAVLDTINAKLVTGTDIGDVTINNSTGAAAVNIQDGGNTITVDGTVAVTGVSTEAKQDTLIGHVDGIETLLGTIDADTGGILTAVQTLDNAISGNEMQVDILTIAAGDNNIGNVDLASAIPAGTNNIGDVDVLTLPRSQSGPGQPGTAVDSYTSDDVNLAANTANQSVVAAPGANKQIWVYGLVGTVDVAGSISIQDEDDTALSGVMPVGITGGFVMNPSGNFSMPWIKVATNKALEIDTVTCTFDGIITYAIVSV